MRLTAERIEAFAGVYLSPRYDSPQPTPPFHRECWARYVSDHPACATAAPRNHAKSTGLTHDFILATACFRDEPYIILVGASEEMAIEHLGDIANELRENEELIRDFYIKGFITEAKTDIIVECTDGYQFRIIARGAEQKIRGRKWRGRRPGLVVFDDIEDDEQVENRDRREKFRRWFFRACKQALRDGGRIRGHGTILDDDSLLAHLMRNKAWDSKLYKAHKGYDDFDDILWPEKFPESRLRAIRTEFENEGDSAGYSQEYLNNPTDNNDRFLKKFYFIEMTDEDKEKFKVYAVGCDFAVSKQDKANRTAFIVGGKDNSNKVHHVDYRFGRWDSLEWVDEMFSIQEMWNPEVWFVEDGVIWKALKRTVDEEMRIRDIWLNIEPMNPTQDKATRAKPWQKRMKAGGCTFDKEHENYAEYEAECLRFTVGVEGVLDDNFDASATLNKGFATYNAPEEEDELTEEEIEFAREAQTQRNKSNGGRSAVTGY